MDNQITSKDLADVKTVTILNSEFNVYGTPEKPLFLAVDVAELIEYSVDKTHQMLELVDDDEKLTDTIYRGGQKREVWFLTENGLYELLMQSRKPLAKKFKIEIKRILNQIRRGEIRSPRTIISNNILIENTKFIYETNFSGDPKRDKFNSSQRKGNIIIPNVEQAIELKNMGFNVKETRPGTDDEGDFTPTYFVAIKMNYDSQWPPKVFLVNDNSNGVLLDKESVSVIDDLWVDNVNAVLNIYEGPNGKSLYVKSMEIFQRIEDDPIASRYKKSSTPVNNDLPF